MPRTVPSFWSLVRATFRDFLEDRCPRMAAAVSYYAIFSLPPLLIILVMVVGTIYGEEAARGEIRRQARGLIGSDAAAQIEAIIQQTNDPTSGRTWALVLGIGGLLFGASAVFGQLQQIFNDIWRCRPDPRRSGFVNFLLKRLNSILLIFGIGAVLIGTLVFSTLMQALSAQLDGGFLGSGLARWLNELVVLVLLVPIFGMLLRYLPDADITWRDIWPAALLAAVLFVLGKFAFSFYISRSNPGSGYGAASSVVLIMLWIYYTSVILMLSAEFSRNWSTTRGDQACADAREAQ